MTSISSAWVKSIETSQKVTVTFVRFKASIVTCNFACIVFAESAEIIGKFQKNG